MNEIIKFEVGKEYGTGSICDSNCIFKFTVISRTEKTVTINSHRGTVRRRIGIFKGQEVISPLGTYSMSPSLWASELC